MDPGSRMTRASATRRVEDTDRSKDCCEDPRAPAETKFESSQDLPQGVCKTAATTTRNVIQHFNYRNLGPTTAALDGLRVNKTEAQRGDNNHST